MDSIASGLRPSWSEMLLIRLSTSCRRSHSPCQYERHVGAVRPVPRSGVHQEIHEGPRRQTTRAPPNYDADLSYMSPLVDGDACGSYLGSLKDLHRSTLSAIIFTVGHTVSHRDGPRRVDNHVGSIPDQPRRRPEAIECIGRPRCLWFTSGVFQGPPP